MGPPGQPLHRRLSRYFWGFPPFLALVETIALAVHFQDMDMVGEGRVAWAPGSGVIRWPPVSVCHQVSTIGQRPPPTISLYQFQASGLIGSPTVPRVRKLLIPTVIDQNPCAHLRMPRDMIFHSLP